ncbi:glycosyltransferase family 4 protein [Tolypothrix bouteillei]|uniref:glycosyltransferase family 4 protein n=1 Tax=Tolypothrix bouteillei TaxID=1246981 RepID=UPI003014D470
MSGKRILCFFPHLEVGGADKFNLDLISLLADRGYDITIATTLKSEHSWHQHFYAVTPNIFHLANFLHETHWLTFARYIIESRQIDVVYISNSYIAYYLLPFLRKEFPHVAFVDYVHCDDPGWRQCGYPRVSCQFSQLLDCQIVSSKWLAEFYQKLKPDTKPKLRVCYTNEDVDKWTPSYEKRTALRSQLKISDDTVVLLFPARIVPQKRPFFVVDIVRELAKKSLKVVVICLGQGYLLPEMQAKIEQLGLQQFFLILPPVQPEQMVDFYSASDILLLPTEYEGISLAIYEAMSMKLSVVASNVGGQSELVIPGTGFLIDKGKGDADELQAYLEVLVPSIQNPELRDKIGFSARQRIAEYFSLDAMVDRMESIFAEAITLRKSDLDVEVNLSIAEELLVFVLEHTSQEKLLEIIWREKCHIEQEKHRIEQEKCHIEHERNTLWHRKNAMETSKFWKIRRLWFKIKQKLGLTQEEP